MLATTIDWASIIFPITPPELLDAAASNGEIPNRSAVIFCRFPNNTFEEASLPVNATPNQPSNGEKNGNKNPVLASAKPIDASSPPNRVEYPKANMTAIVINEVVVRRMVPTKIQKRRFGGTPNNAPDRMAEKNKAVPVADNQFHSKIAFSGVGWGTTGISLITPRWSNGTSNSERVHLLSWLFT